MASPRPYPTTSIFGVPVSKMNMAETVAYLTDRIEQRGANQVVTANPIMLMAGLENEAYMRVLKEAELSVPDGTGVVWAAQRAGEPVKERVAGFDLLHELMREGDRRGWKAYLLGSTDEVIQAARQKLEAQYPGVKIVGARNGFFSTEEDAAVIESIRDVSPDLLFVARSLTTQEPWIHKHKQVLGVPVMMGVGGSFDVISGKTKRAPEMFIKLRSEWLYRLLKEPWRAKRMLALPKFAVRVLLEKKS